MTISFKCSCGREISVPDESAGREAFCPGCRKSVPVPGGGELEARPPADEREASEFRPGALANLLGDYLPKKPGEEKEIVHSQRGDEAPAAAGPEPEPEPVKTAASKEPPEKEEMPPEAEKEEEQKEPEPAAAEKAPEEKKPEPEKEPGAAREEEQAKAAAEVPAGEIKVAPAAETQDVEPPPGVEVFPDKIKFHCECGQKVAVRIPAPRGAGTCPRCKRKLKVPDVPGLATKQAGERPAAAAVKGLRHCSKCGRRIEDSGAAFCPRCGFPLSFLSPPTGVGKKPQAAPPEKAEEPPASAAEKMALSKDARKKLAREASLLAADRLRPASRSGGAAPAGDLSLLAAEPAGLGRRLGAFGLDALATIALAVSGHQLAGSVGLEAAGPAALAAAGVFALLNEVVFAALAGGRSLGMVIAGLRVMGHEGRPAGPLLLFARLLAWLVLFVGAPLALFDGQKRTLHDLVCGTTVRRLLRA